MSATLTSPPSAVPAPVPSRTPMTMADLLRKLGDIPPERVIMDPPPGKATEADVIRLEAQADKRLCELIDGTLVEKAMGFPESLFAGNVYFAVKAFVKQRKLGHVATSDGMIRVFTGRVRLPDVAYFSWNRLPNRAWPTEQIAGFSPNLAVEVLSPSNTEGEMVSKRQDYFGSGVELLWEFRLSPREVRVLTPTSDITLRPPDVLDGGTVLPGFQLSLADLYAEMDEQG